MEVDDEDNGEDVEKLEIVNKVVKSILILDHSKKPFKQNDVIGFLSNKPNRKMLPAIFDEAKKKLSHLGLSLQETKNTNVKSYFLSSTVPPLPFMHLYAKENEVADRTLLVLVLAFIFMLERPVTDDELFNHLQRLRIYNTEKSVHWYFGDVKKKIMTEYVTQLYLEKVIDKEMNTIHINWGERAHAEISKKSILEFVCEIGYQGKIHPKDLVSHYTKAMEGEELERNQEVPENVEDME